MPFYKIMDRNLAAYIRNGYISQASSNLRSSQRLSFSGRAGLQSKWPLSEWYPQLDFSDPGNPFLLGLNVPEISWEELFPAFLQVWSTTQAHHIPGDSRRISFPVFREIWSTLKLTNRLTSCRKSLFGIAPCLKYWARVSFPKPRGGGSFSKYTTSFEVRRKESLLSPHDRGLLR